MTGLVAFTAGTSLQLQLQLRMPAKWSGCNCTRERKSKCRSSSEQAPRRTAEPSPLTFPRGPPPRGPTRGPLTTPMKQWVRCRNAVIIFTPFNRRPLCGGRFSTLSYSSPRPYFDYILSFLLPTIELRMVETFFLSLIWLSFDLSTIKVEIPLSPAKEERRGGGISWTLRMCRGVLHSSGPLLIFTLIQMGEWRAEARVARERVSTHQRQSSMAGAPRSGVLTCNKTQHTISLTFSRNIYYILNIYWLFKDSSCFGVEATPKQTLSAGWRQTTSNFFGLLITREWTISSDALLAIDVVRSWVLFRHTVIVFNMHFRSENTTSVMDAITVMLQLLRNM